MIPTTVDAPVPVAFVVRWMTKEDVPQCVRIEHDADVFDAWREKHFYFFFAKQRRGALVAVKGRKVLGHVAFETKPKSNVILNLVVAPAFRRAGVGRELLRRIALIRGRRARDVCTFEIRAAGVSPQLFLKACGWRCERIIKGAFRSPDDDGYRFYWRRPKG